MEQSQKKKIVINKENMSFGQRQFAEFMEEHYDWETGDELRRKIASGEYVPKATNIKEWAKSNLGIDLDD
ncbi:hypothetical protein [Paraburkholderia tropica]|uniref:hypothetical protein n=1 Tax=Paraburkholderia tropica TaxID=92647 RepID=UPI003D2A51AD